jgi:hypothetical protein
MNTNEKCDFLANARQQQFSSPSSRIGEKASKILHTVQRSDDSEPGHTKIFQNEEDH